jgi:hypothetical protein
MTMMMTMIFVRFLFCCFCIVWIVSIHVSFPCHGCSTVAKFHPLILTLIQI